MGNSTGRLFYLYQSLKLPIFILIAYGLNKINQIGSSMHYRRDGQISCSSLCILTAGTFGCENAPTVPACRCSTENFQLNFNRATYGVQVRVWPASDTQKGVNNRKPYVYSAIGCMILGFFTGCHSIL